jgi:hypothetical protein
MFPDDEQIGPAEQGRVEADVGKSSKRAEFTYEFFCGDNERSVIIDDDGRVAYAYLVGAKKEIYGDVWLYNRGPAPIAPEWHDRDAGPYANPADYVDQTIVFPLPRSPADISVEWEVRDGHYIAYVFFYQKLVAILADDFKPGWALLAKNDGPLAKVMRFNAQGEIE